MKCICGHYYVGHSPQSPHKCYEDCGCEGFEKAPEDQPELPFEDRRDEPRGEDSN